MELTEPPESTATTDLSSTTGVTGSSADDFGDQIGVRVSPNKDLSSISFTVDEATDGANRVEVLRASDSKTIASKSIDDGGTYSINTTLSSANDYLVLADNSSGDFSYSYTDDSTWPETSAYGDIENSVAQTYSGSSSSSTSEAFVFESVRFKKEAAEEGTYLSANHSVDEAEQFSVNITALSNATVTLSAEYWTGSDWQTANSTTVSNTGNHTTAVPTVSSSTWRVRAAYSKSSAYPEFEIADEAILFTNHDPAVENSSATPSGGSPLQDKNVDLSINVSDSEFGTVQGDNVSVTFYDASDDSSIGTDTLTSNGTATVEWTDTVGGTNNWYAIARDDYGGQVQSETFSFSAPGTLYIRNETNTSELVGSPVDTTVRFFGSDKIYSRSSSDGTVNLSGLPVDEDFIVEVDPNSDYHGRTVYIQSLYEQQTVYLLSKNEENVESRFTLEDPTGQYDSSTVVFIEKPINQSDSVTYRTIHADKFGTEGVTAELHKGARYRIRIRSATGTTQDIGPYRADVGETVTVRPGSPTIELGNLTEGWGANASIDNTTIEYVYEDPDGLTDSVTVSVHQKGNKSNSLESRTYHDLGRLSGTYSLSENQSDETWVVTFDVDRDGETFTVREEVSNKPDLVPGLSNAWRLVVGIGLMLISAGVFSLLNASVGGVVVAIEGGILWWTGWLGGATTGAGIAIAIFVAVMVHIYSSSGP